MRFSAVIATKGRPAPLARALESLSRCDPAPDEVLVVDGDEAQSARAVVQSAAARLGQRRVAVVHVASRPGLTVQRNVGADRASGEVIVYLDDDVVCDRRLFEVLARAYRDPSVVGATGRIIEDQGRRYGNSASVIRTLLPGGGEEGSMTRFGYPRRLQDPSGERDVEFMQGCLMSARGEAVRQLRFDECLQGYALAEDEDFSYRLSRAGRLRYLPDAVVHHENTGGRGSSGRDFNRLVVVNRTYLFRKNFSRTRLARMQFAMFIGALLVHRAVNLEWQGVRGLLEGALEAWRKRSD